MKQGSILGNSRTDRGTIVSNTNRAYLVHSLSHLAVNKARSKDELSSSVGTSQEILFKTNTVFPFTLIPDTLTIDRTNITITHRVFFKMAVIITIKIEDILNVTPNIGPFFGSLRIMTAFMDKKSPYMVNYLTRDDALRVNRILQGYKIALQQKIDTSNLSKEELVHLLDRLSHDGTEAS
ncbi:MAG TPA: hypothetical protein VD706_01810 [Candidatus Saccharimonadales bacterium]|nr:hypothetical protein [Candidatus Saccharimonadales bacterium]